MKQLYISKVLLLLNGKQKYTELLSFLKEAVKKSLVKMYRRLLWLWLMFLQKNWDVHLAAWSILTCGPLSSTCRLADLVHMLRTGLWTDVFPGPKVRLCDPTTEQTSKSKPTCKDSKVSQFLQLDSRKKNKLTCTSTWKPSLNVPRKIKFREVPSRNWSPLPSATALIVPYWSGT